MNDATRNADQDAVSMQREFLDAVRIDIVRTNRKLFAALEKGDAGAARPVFEELALLLKCEEVNAKIFADLLAARVVQDKELEEMAERARLAREALGPRDV